MMLADHSQFEAVLLGDLCLQKSLLVNLGDIFSARRVLSI
jgi:hypothetical protein